MVHDRAEHAAGCYSVDQTTRGRRTSSDLSAKVRRRFVSSPDAMSTNSKTGGSAVDPNAAVEHISTAGEHHGEQLPLLDACLAAASHVLWQMALNWEKMDPCNNFKQSGLSSALARLNFNALTLPLHSGLWSF